MSKQYFGASKALAIVPLTAGLLFLTIGQQPNQAQASTVTYKSRWFQESGFQLNVRVRVYEANRIDALHVSYVKEFYSNEEKRAKLVVKPVVSAGRRLRAEPIDKFILDIMQAPDESAFYFDGAPGRGQMLRVLSRAGSLIENSCKLADNATLAEDMFGKLAREDLNNLVGSWWADTPEAPGFIIGLARVHFMVVANSDKLIATLDTRAQIRNHDAIQYDLKLPIGKLSVYYAKADDPTTGDQVPLRAWLKTEAGNELIMDFSRVFPLSHLSLTSENLKDLFQFPLDVGCSSQLPDADLFNGGPPFRVLSMRAKVHDFVSSGPPLSYFLAFDALAGLLRRDLLAQPDDGLTYNSVTIHDLRICRKYNYRIPIAREEPTILELASGEYHMADRSQCIATKVVGQRSLLDPPFMSGSLKAMGVERVRDVDTLVFEQQTAKLPAALFPVVQYRDENGNLKFSFLPQGQDEQNFQIQYYVARAGIAIPQDNQPPSTCMWYLGKPLGPLMRIDVKRDKFLIYQIEVEDFHWTLSESPNGDPPGELFALRDRCTNDLARPETRGELRLELQFRSDEQPRGAPSAKEASVLFASPLDRRLALSRGIARTTKYGSPMMFSNIESYMRKSSDDGFRMWANIQLQLPRQPLYQTVIAGEGIAKISVDYTIADTFDECHWQAAHLMRDTGNRVLFSFCFEKCIIDQHVSWANDGTTVYHSSMFQHTVKSDMACKLFRFEVGTHIKSKDVDKRELDFDEVEMLAYRDYWYSLKRDLDNGRIEIPLESVADHTQGSHTALLVKSVSVSGERWGNQLDDVQGIDASQSKRSPLDGLALPAKFSKIVKSKIPNGQMSESLCRASCLISDRCRSYSVCTTRASVECYISGLEFRYNENILKQISERPKSATKLTINLANPDDDSGEEDEGVVENESQTVVSAELRVDRRCKIRSKRALELFRRERRVSLAYIKGMPVVAADSEEQCAELCLKNNLHFLKSLKRKTDRFHEATADVQTAAEAHAIATQQKPANLRSWCPAFHFHSFGESVPKAVQDLLEPMKLSKRGLCFKPRLAPAPSPSANISQPMEQKDRDTKTEMKFDASRFEFLYKNLFEAQYGQKLLPLPPVSKGLSELTPRELSQVNNQKFLAASEPEECAKACFMQTAGLIPHCKSFGFSRRHREKRSICTLNSMTMAEAMSSQLRDRLVTSISQEDHFTHYEPRDLLGMHGFSLRPGQEFLGEEISVSQVATGEPEINLTGILVIVALAFGSGLGLVHLLAIKLNRLAAAKDTDGRRESVEFPSSSFLSSLLLGDNRVTHRRFEPEIDLPDIINANADTL